MLKQHVESTMKIFSVVQHKIAEELLSSSYREAQLELMGKIL